jgi:prefoldin subunit 5
MADLAQTQKKLEEAKRDLAKTMAALEELKLSKGGPKELCINSPPVFSGKRSEFSAFVDSF